MDGEGPGSLSAGESGGSGTFAQSPGGKDFVSVGWQCGRKSRKRETGGVVPGVVKQGETTRPHETGSGVQLARFASGARHGDAVDCRTDCGNARTSSPGSFSLVDHQRDLCQQTA